MIKIHFGLSPSPNFQFALAEAEKSASWTTSGDGKDARHTAEYPFADLPKALRLWDLVGNWKTAALKVDGEELDRGGIAKLKDVHACWRKGYELPNTEAYCRTVSPVRAHPEDEIQRTLNRCRQMRILKWGFSWLDHGYVTLSGSWAIDKEWLRGQAGNELWRTRVDLCPLFDKAALDQALEDIPEEFDPSWIYETAKVEKPAAKPSNVLQFRPRG